MLRDWSHILNTNMHKILTNTRFGNLTKLVKCPTYFNCHLPSPGDDQESPKNDDSEIMERLVSLIFLPWGKSLIRVVKD